ATPPRWSWSSGRTGSRCSTCMRGPAGRRCRRSTSRPPGAARRRRSARRSCTRDVPACWATRGLGSRTRTCGISRRRGLASRRASRSARSSRADATPRANGGAAPLEQALTGGARILTGARHPLVYLAGDISSETQREAVAIADRLHAAIDSLAATAAPAVLAAQRRGRAGATLGEIRQRADLVVFWAVDPSGRYPRYSSRYAVEPRGVAAPQGRQSRTLIAVDVGENLGPAHSDGRVAIAPGDEVDSLEMMRATVQG